MTTNIATTKEQSVRLRQCGVDPETADMMFTPHNTLSADPYKEGLKDRGYFPAWSLISLLGLLPKTISDFWMTKWFVPIVDGFQIDDMENPYLLSGDFQLLHIGGGKYQVEYDWDGFRGKLPQSDNPIEACVLAVELLAANNYKLNEL